MGKNDAVAINNSGVEQAAPTDVPVKPSSSTTASSIGGPGGLKPQPRPEVRQCFSELQRSRLATPPAVPAVLKTPNVEVLVKEAVGAAGDHDKIQELFPKTFGRPRVELAQSSKDDHKKAGGRPLRVGVVLSGGQASGGHNVIAGIYDYVKSVSPQSVLIGFANGPKGIFKGKYYEVDQSMMDTYRNTGGFDMLGAGRDKIESPEQFAASQSVCEELRLDGLVVIGGDDSNTNAAVLAEYFEANNCSTKVIGCPKTIDGDLKNQYIPVSFGFDTACKTYSELIGNVMLDCLSSQKYWHFVRLMGRAASHIALECALTTRPNAVLISEEIQAKHMSLSDVTRTLVDMIVKRAKQGKNYGVVLLPEGLIEFIPEFDHLMSELNDLMASGVPNNEKAVMEELSFNNRAVFSYLPANIKEQLLLDRDPHGNVQVAKIETEKLLAGTIAQELERERHHGLYGGSFKPQFHSFGYEGRAGMPSEFDSNYCYSLGLTAGQLIGQGLNSLMVSITDVTGPVEKWRCGGVPLTMMMNMEKRHGKMKPVIRKALVELDGKPFQVLSKRREAWALNDAYRAPGPVQFHGPTSHEVTLTLRYEQLPEKEVKDGEAAPRPFKFLGSYAFSPVPKDCLSGLQLSRLSYKHRVPSALADGSVDTVEVKLGEATQCVQAKDRQLMMKEFPTSYGLPLVKLEPKGAPALVRMSSSYLEEPKVETVAPLEGGGAVGVVFCGRQTPGGHNVVAGLLDFLGGSGARLLGFVGGVHGLFKKQFVEVTPELVAGYRNQGGLDLLGRSMETFDTKEHMDAIKDTCAALKLQGLVFIGGARTATGVAYLHEYLRASQVPTVVTVVPCSIDGTMANQFVETSVGYHTACQVYGELVGNTAIDGASAKKYWMFLRLMGADPSNIALEVALQSAPNMVLLAEEVDAQRKSLQDVVKEIANLVCERAKSGKNYGTVLVPEGLVLSIPEMAVLINEVDDIFRESAFEGDMSVEAMASRLTTWSAALLRSMPPYIQLQLVKERQSNKKVQLSQIETERLLAHFVQEELERRKRVKQYEGSFNAVCSFLGYQARGSLPSNFDCNYGYSLGGAAACLVYRGLSGYMAAITGLKGVEEQDWKVAGVPLTAMLVLDDRDQALAYNGQLRPRVPAKKVELHGAAYKALLEKKKIWGQGDYYQNSGPLQFEGPTADSRPASLVAEDRDYLAELDVLHAAINKVRAACRPGCSSALLHMATKSILTLTDVVNMMDEASS